MPEPSPSPTAPAGEHRYQQASTVLSRHSLDACLLLPVGAGDPVALTGSAEALWQCFEGANTFTEAVAVLHVRFGIPLEQLRADFLATFETLTATGALVPVP